MDAPEHEYRAKRAQKLVLETVPKPREYENIKVDSSKAPKKESHPILNRIIGGLKTIGGILEIKLGAVLTATGIGAIIGVPLIAHGADVTQSGVRQLITGEPVRTFTSEYLLQKGLGLSERTSEWIDAGISIVAGFAQAARAGLTRLASNARISAARGWSFGLTRNGALGETLIDGRIIINPRTMAAGEFMPTFTHEGVHRLLTPLGSGTLTTARQGLKAWGYQYSNILRVTEETLAEAAATGSWWRGLVYGVGELRWSGWWGLTFDVGATATYTGIGYSIYDDLK